MRAKLFRTSVQATVALSLAVAALAAQAVLVDAGAQVNFRDPATGTVLVPPANLASDPSFAGTVVASQTLKLDFPDANGTRLDIGFLDDWVVRRADTGTLDFYTRFRIDSPGLYSGGFERAWNPLGSPSVEIDWRDDLSLPGSSPPTGVWVSGVPDPRFGHGLQEASAFWNRLDGVPNWLNDAGTMVMRSTSTEFHFDHGSVSYLAEGATFDDWHGTSVLFYAPVPEPSTALLLLLGLPLAWRLSRCSNPPPETRPS